MRIFFVRQGKKRRNTFVFRGFLTQAGGKDAVFIDERSESRGRACTDMTEQAKSTNGYHAPKAHGSGACPGDNTHLYLGVNWESV